MRILCDVDGVFADFLGHTIFYLGDKAPGEEEFTSWNLLDHLSKEEAEFCNALWRLPSWCKDIPLLPGAQVAHKELAALGKVLWVTAPVRNSRYWHLERISWLEAHFGVDEDDVVFTHDKSHVWGDVIIDDRLENVEGWAKAHPAGLPILWDRPYNRSRTPEGIHRVKTWEEVLCLVTQFKAGLEDSAPPEEVTVTVRREDQDLTVLLRSQKEGSWEVVEALDEQGVGVPLSLLEIAAASWAAQQGYNEVGF
jgi:5'(3')-deoxyribonucleotidase